MINKNPVLRVQIAQIDHTMARSNILDYTKSPRAPIIRIYGASSLGLKTCLHVHQVYPYFFVDYLGQLDPNHSECFDFSRIIWSDNKHPSQ